MGVYFGLKTECQNRDDHTKYAFGKRIESFQIGLPLFHAKTPTPSIEVLFYVDLISPPSMRTALPVIQRAAGETRNAIKSAISSGLP